MRGGLSGRAIASPLTCRTSQRRSPRSCRGRRSRRCGPARRRGRHCWGPVIRQPGDSAQGHVLVLGDVPVVQEVRHDQYGARRNHQKRQGKTAATEAAGLDWPRFWSSLSHLLKCSDCAAVFTG